MDKGGAPYLGHVLRVAAQMRTDGERAVALLHDVVEDTSVTLADLREAGFAEDVVAAVEAIAKYKGELPAEYLARLRHSPLACRVKLADLADNMDLRRIANPGEADYARLRKYQWMATELRRFGGGPPHSP